MPYTPPAQQSPAASRPETPTALSRNSSCVKILQQHGNQSSFHISPRPALPRSVSSTSYLHRHRRSPTVNNSSVVSGSPDTPDVTPVDGRIELNSEKAPQSTSPRRAAPKMLELTARPTLSPPDSKENSSDEEPPAREGRSRKLENLAELQAAIRNIEQHRESSPERAEAEKRRAKVALGLIVPSESPASAIREVKKSATLSLLARPPLSAEARKISHSRSATESAAYLDLSRPSDRRDSQSVSDSDDEEDMGMHKPPMVRKKSGELVRPALRPYSKRRPSSMPGTPTYSKAVHFDSHLEHVRHFLQVDRPLAVSVGSSPVETMDSEVEFPFTNHHTSMSHSTLRGPSHQWELKLPNMPSDSVERRSMPVRVEKVFLSADTKTLIGVVAVQNLAFHKFVAVRFTLDYWKTTSEVVAEYNNDVRRKEANDGIDRFNFNLKLDDQVNLENKTMFFCVRYNVNGQEYWDSNGGGNYQVDFVPKVVPRRSQHSASSSLNNLPRSRALPMSSSKPRPKTTAFDEFTGRDFYDSLTFPPSAQLSPERTIKLRNPRTANPSAGPDSVRAKPTSGQAFGNRYDFRASLSAAMQSTSNSTGDKSASPANDDFTFPPRKTPTSSVDVAASRAISGAPMDATKPTSSAVDERTAPVVKGHIPKPAALTSEKPPMQSQSYTELLDKYCFFGSAKALPATSKAALGQVDGAEDHRALTDHRSASPSPPPSPTTVVEPHVASLPTISRASSRTSGTGLDPRAESPASFAYPYATMQNSFFADPCAPTAIHG